MTRKQGRTAALRKHRRVAKATFACLASACVGLSICGGAIAAPVGQVTELPNGLQPANGSIPYGIAAGSDGNLWFGDQGTTKAISQVTPGDTVTEFSTGLQPSNGSQPQWVATGTDGNVWFTDSGTTHAIGKITPGGTITEYTAGLQPSNGSALFGIAAGPDGNMWFTDVGTTRAIGKITPSGAITEYTVGLQAANASNPQLIAPGPDGNMWFTDDGTTKEIGEITPSGTVTEFSAGLNAGASPFGIAPGPDGNMWFTDQGSTDAIGRITPMGHIAEYSAGLRGNTVTFAYGIAPGPDGDMWFTDAGQGSNTGAIGRIDPSTGTIDDFTAGLQSLSAPLGLAPGTDGNMWFTDQGATHELGRAGTGAPGALVRAPSVTGSSEQGTPQVCQGDRWATWAGQQPSQNSSSSLPPGVQWLRDGAPLAGQTGQSYTPAAADVGHALSCTVAVTYPLLGVTDLVTSVGVNVIPQNAGPTGPPGAQGPPGRDATVTCKAKGTKKVKCKVAFASAAGVRKARLSRGGVTYAEGKPATSGGKLVLRFRSAHRLASGRYTLTVVQHLDGHRVVTRSPVRVV